jgi:hypothetical protein
MNNKLKIKIMEVLVDYKFNSTSVETTEMVAERIFNIIKNYNKEMK